MTPPKLGFRDSPFCSSLLGTSNKDAAFKALEKAEVALAASRLAIRLDGIAVDVIQTSKPELRIMRYELSDYEWTAIKPMLYNKPRGVRRENDRRVCEV